jgi:hypothetical protein
MSLDVQLLILALEAALYPTLLAAVVVLLSQPRPKRLLAAYLAGGLVISIGAGCAIVYGLAHSGTLESSSSTTSWTTDLALGGLSLLAAVALAVHADERFAERRRARRPEPPRDADPPSGEPWSTRILARGSVPLVFLAGFVINLPGAAYLIALKDIAADQTSAGRAVARILAFNAIMFLLAEVPLAGLVVAPEPTHRLIASFQGWLSSHSRSIAIVLCAGLGAFLVARGLINA